MNTKYPKESQSQLIGRLGEDAFSAQRPESWLCTEVKKDFGIDYLVQIKQEEHLNSAILVQLKTTGEPYYSIDGSIISLPIKVTTLEYYKNLVFIPILILFCDFSSHETDRTKAPIYYVWFQEHIKNYCLKKIDSQIFYTLHFPIKNIFNKEIEAIALKMVKKSADSFYNTLRNEEFNRVNYVSEKFLPTIPIIEEEIFHLSTWHVQLNAFLPFIKEGKLTGSCSIAFSLNTVQSCIVTFSHKEIINYLFSGVKTSYSSKLRKFIIGPFTKNNEEHQVIKLGNSTLVLPIRYVIDLCTILDGMFFTYYERLLAIENLFNSHNFKISSNGKAFHLIRVKRYWWRLLHEFVEEFDQEKGNSEWNIFSDSNNYSITVMQNVNLMEGIYSTKLIPIFIHNNDWSGETCFYPDNEISIGWEIPSDTVLAYSKFSEKGLWNVEQTYDWLTKKFIPYVAYYYNVIKREKEKKWFWQKNKKVTYESYSQEFNKKNIHQCEKILPLLKLEKINTHQSFLELLEQLQSHLASNYNYPIFHTNKNVQEIYLALKICLEESSNIFLGYIITNLGAHHIKDKKTLIEFIYKKTNENKQRLNNHELDYLLRCFIEITDLTERQFSIDTILKIKKNIEWLWEGVNTMLFLQKTSNFS